MKTDLVHTLTFKDNSFWFVTLMGTEQQVETSIALQHKWLSDKKAQRIWDRILVKRYPLEEYRLPDFLDPHQREGVSWILSRSRSYLAHAPGAGKTCEAIVASQLANGQGQVLFIVPPSLTVNWERECLKWFYRAFSIALVPNSARRDGMDWTADYIICPDSMLTRPWVLENLSAKKWKFIAVDEASRFKDPDAQRTRALFGGKVNDTTHSPGLVQLSPYSVLLDGSPMPNRPMELWAPLFAMSPETIDFADQHSFGMRYCGATLNERGCWEYKHASHDQELQDKMRQSFMHVVPEAVLNHPERKRSLLFMTKDARSAPHKKWEKANLSKINLSDIDESASQGDLARFRRELGERKVSWVADYVKDRLKNTNESILLFGWHRDVVMNLGIELHMFRPGIVMGGTNAILREQHFKDFQAGLTRLLIMNIAAGGRGHNLQRADRVIFAEYSWCDETNKQAEKRASRKGSKKASVRCEYIVNPDSMDEIILQAVMRKAETVKKIIG